jgi:hypothetical protein
MLYREHYGLPEYDLREILRYAGADKDVPELRQVLKDCTDECRDVFSGKVCYTKVPVCVSESSVDLSFASVQSRALAKNLSGCEYAVVFAATVGIGIDRLIQKYSKTDVSKAVWMQAIGAERIEALCDLFCKDIREKEQPFGFYTRPRFSPGYGDLSITLQQDIIQVLDCYRKIGIALNQSLLMIPSKSVTAIIGLGKGACTHEQNTCRRCEQKDCLFRKERT